MGYDVEKGPQYSTSDSPPAIDGLIKQHGKLMQEDGAVPGETFEIGDTWYAKSMRLAGKLRIEQRGIERVPENERHDTGFKGLLNAGTMVSRWNRILVRNWQC
jgi:hypothetical protein